VTLLATICAIDLQLEGFFLFRPIIVAPLVGLALGDIQTGLLGGALAELAFAGITAVGGTVPPDPVLAGVMTVVLARTTGQPVTATFAMSIPFAILAQYASLLYNTALAFVNPRAERYAKEGNVKGILNLCTVSIILHALVYAVIIFLSTYVAQNGIRILVESLPEWLTHGLDVAGGLIPAVGFAMLLKVMLKGSFVPYLFLGFLFATFIPFDNILPVGILGVACALIAFYQSAKGPGGRVDGAIPIDGPEGGSDVGI
jgi:PTS system galactosamine-specific IIC component